MRLFAVLNPGILHEPVLDFGQAPLYVGALNQSFGQLHASPF
jgi:hypothetical protein